jgi:hypothetical protein
LNIKIKIKEAAEFLDRRGRRIEIIFFGLILVFAALAPLMIYAYIEHLFAVLTSYIVGLARLTVVQGNAIYIAFLVLAVFIVLCFLAFFTMPLFSCFFGHSYRLYRNGIAGKSKLFALGKGGYWGAIKAGCVIFVLLAICLAPVIIISFVGSSLAESDNEVIVALVKYLFVFAIAAGLALGFLIFILLRPLFLFVYYTSRGESAGAAILLSVKRMRSHRAKEMYNKYIKSFLPSLLLSLATVLVLFFVDTLPKMSMVYFEVADEIAYCEE